MMVDIVNRKNIYIGSLLKRNKPILNYHYPPRIHLNIVHLEYRQSDPSRIQTLHYPPPYSRDNQSLLTRSSHNVKFNVVNINLYMFLTWNHIELALCMKMTLFPIQKSSVKSPQDGFLAGSRTQSRRPHATYRMSS